MSTDLELSPNLPKIRLQPIRIHSSSAADDSTSTSAVQRSVSDEECRTPTSEEHKIPTTLTCPPAPRKPKREASCKRKLSEFEFFEHENRKEVDGFFIVSSHLLTKRRNCAC